MTNKQLLKEIKLGYPNEYKESFEEEISKLNACSKCNSNEYVTCLVYDKSTYKSKNLFFDHGLYKMNDSRYEGPDRYCRKCKSYFIHTYKL